MGVVVVLAAAALVLALTRGGNQEQERALADWQSDVQSWRAQQVEALALPEGPALTAVVTGAAMTPIGGEGTGESIDEVNAACTRLTAFTDVVRDTPGPPALPAGLDADQDQLAAFEASLAALTTFQQAVSEPAATVRQFCGTYPLLILAHTAEGEADEARLAFARALETQCPLADLAEACRALASGARIAAGDAEGEPPAIEPERIRSVIAENLAAVEDQIDGAASAFAADLTSA